MRAGLDLTTIVAVAGVDWGVESAWARTALALLEGMAATEAQRRECCNTVRSYLDRVEGVANVRGDKLKEIAAGAVSPQHRKREVVAVFEESTLRLVVPLWDTAWLVDLASQASVVPMRLVLRTVVGEAVAAGAERFTVEDATPLDAKEKFAAPKEGDRVVVVTLYSLELDEEAARFTIRSQEVAAANRPQASPSLCAKDILAVLGSGRVRIGLRRTAEGGMQVHFEDAPAGETWADQAGARP